MSTTPHDTEQPTPPRKKLTVPGVRAVHDIPVEPGRGLLINALLWTVPRFRLLDPIRPLTTLLEFG